MLYPHTLASPQLGLSSVARMRMVVVLPAPLGPMKPYTSPFSSFSVSRLRAYRSPYIFVRSRVSIMGQSLKNQEPNHKNQIPRTNISGGSQEPDLKSQQIGSWNLVLGYFATSTLTGMKKRR